MLPARYRPPSEMESVQGSSPGPLGKVEGVGRGEFLEVWLRVKRGPGLVALGKKDGNRGTGKSKEARSLTELTNNKVLSWSVGERAMRWQGINVDD